MNPIALDTAVIAPTSADRTAVPRVPSEFLTLFSIDWCTSGEIGRLLYHSPALR